MSELTLTEFLLARIAEDEAHFHAMAEHEADRCRHDGMPDTTRDEVEAYWLRREDGAAVTEWPRWLAECEAKRRIVKQARAAIALSDKVLGTADPDVGRIHGAATAWEYALDALVQPYADHPDYRPEWTA